MDDVMLKLSSDDVMERVRRAVQARGGNLTLGDVMADTGLPKFEAERALKSLLSLYQGHLSVSEQGDLLYAFNPQLIRRDYRSFWQRNKETIFKVLKTTFKIWIMVTLVVYFIVYMLLILALLFGNRNSNSSSSSSSSFNPLFMYWLFWGRGDYYGNNSYKSQSKEKRVPFNKRIFQFVFGPEDQVKQDPLRLQKMAAQLIKSKKGVISLQDWIMVTGHDKSVAENELAHYSAIFDGNVEVSGQGNIIYTFPEMMRSERNKALPAAPSPSWQELEAPRAFTGNSTGSNVGIAMLNFFNLGMASFLAYSFSQAGVEIIIEDFMVESTMVMHPIYPILLGYFPMVFSLLFFLIPLIRYSSHRRENRKRRKRNIKKVIHRNIFLSTVTSVPSLTDEKLEISVDDALSKKSMKLVDKEELRGELREVLADFGGDIVSNDSGDVAYSFEHFKKSMDNVAKERERLKLDKQELGDVVFDTAEDYTASGAEAQSEDKELALFSSQLENYTSAKR
ncbi:MAG: hypothetical protein WC966_00945 [Bradymonadales bacterium]|jgi:hypothetical protein